MIVPAEDDFVYIDFDPQSGQEQAVHRPEKSLDWKSGGMKIVGKAPDDIIQRCAHNIHKFIFI